MSAGESGDGRLVLAIPNWNGGRYLAGTLSSLRVQSRHVRWHFQDGASTDGSVALARAEAGEGDAVVSEPDEGQSDALNRAIASMGGDIIGWINSDDLLEDGAAEAVVQAFRSHPGVDIVYGEVDWIDAGGAVTGHHAGRIDSLPEMLDIYGVWWNRRQWVQPEVFFRRSLWERAGPIRTDLDLAFDYALWVRFMEAGARTLRLPRTLARFRLHEAQKSTRADEAADEIRRVAGDALARNRRRLPAGLRRRTARLIAYDRHRLDAGAGSLAAALFRRPDWLLIPEVRRRLVASLSARVADSRSATK